jgi:hypothetical protein
MGSRRSKRCECTLSGYLRRSVWLLVVLLSGVGAGLRVSQAADAPDDGLLEFLGSADTGDKDWNDYLARTDIDKIARRTGNNAGNPGGGGTPVRVKPVDPPADPPADPPVDAPPASPPIANKPVAPP